jgi:hypothetical protein
LRFLLTAQWAIGAILGIAAQPVLVVIIIGYVMPSFGPDLLEMAHDVAGRIGQLVGSIR